MYPNANPEQQNGADGRQGGYYPPTTPQPDNNYGPTNAYTTPSNPPGQPPYNYYNPGPATQYPPTTPQGYGPYGYNGTGPNGYNPPPPAPKNNTGLILGIVGGVAVVAIVVVALLVLVIKPDGSNSSNSTQVAANPTAASATTTAAPGTTAATGTTSAPVTTAAPVATTAPVATQPPTTVAEPTQTTEPAATATPKPATTRAATPKPATPGTSTNISSLSVPTYAGMKKVTVPESLQAELAPSLSSTPNAKVEAYVSKDNLEKLKTFYIAEFPKAGWKDVTTDSAAGAGNSETVEQLEAAGLFLKAFQKDADYVAVLGVPAEVAPSLGILDAPAGGTVIIFIGGGDN